MSTTAAARKPAAKKPGSKPAAKKPASARRRGRPTAATSARQIAVEILTANGGPMKVAELSQQVVATGRANLKGKTPAATVAAHIYVAAKAGELFRKTERGVVELLPAARETGDA